MSSVKKKYKKRQALKRRGCTQSAPRNAPTPPHAPGLWPTCPLAQPSRCRPVRVGSGGGGGGGGGVRETAGAVVFLAPLSLSPPTPIGQARHARADPRTWDKTTRANRAATRVAAVIRMAYCGGGMRGFGGGGVSFMWEWSRAGGPTPPPLFHFLPRRGCPSSHTPRQPWDAGSPHAGR